MKQLIIILALCITFPSVSFAASIEQERMQERIQQEQEEQQKQREQQTTQSNYGDEEVDRGIDNQKKGVCYLNVPKGYFVCPKIGKLYPIKK